MCKLEIDKVEIYYSIIIDLVSLKPNFEIYKATKCISVFRSKMLIMEGNGPLKSKENAKKGFQIVLDATVAQSFVHWRQQKGIR